jgi:predicted MFS family arabinose efflux permease
VKSIASASSEPRASQGSLHALDWLNFFLADVQSGVGPFLAIYLAQTPAGALADRVHSKRTLVAVGVVALAVGALTTAVGIGAALSQTIAGTIVHRFGYHAGFLFLASVAAAAFLLLWFAMPETRDRPAPSSHTGRPRPATAAM